MTIESAANPAAAALRDLAGGRVHLPGDAEYDGARMPWNVAVDQRPAAVALPQTTAEVSALVRAAAENGLKIAPQSTGHNAAPLAARGLDDTVIVRTSEMNSVSIDPSRRSARVEGGAMWMDAVEPAGLHGLAALHGSSPDVGIAGYSLGGGTGWYARQHGLACNSLTAVEVVVGDGTLVRADAEHEAALFWALRGGGGSFGVVTALEFQLYPIETAYAGMLMWDIAETEKVLRTWAAWAPGAPDEVTTSFRILRLPPIPDIPEFLRGRSVVMIDGAVLGSDDRGSEVLAGLRALQPEIDTFGRVPAPTLSRLHMDPEGPTPAVSSCSTLESLPDAGVDAFIAAIGPDAQTSLLFGELRQFGGALGRRVRMPPVDVRTEVDAEQIAVAQSVVGGQAVQHDVVDRRADDSGVRRGREVRVVAEERRPGARIVQHLAGGLVELAKRDPDSRLRPHLGMDRRDDLAGGPHRLDLIGGLELDHGAPLSVREVGAMSHQLRPRAAISRQQFGSRLAG